MKKILFILFFIFSFPSFALDIPSEPQGYINDYAGLVDPQVEQSLERELYKFEQSDSTQIVVATFDSLEGGSLEDFSIRLADQWKIGQKGNDNGVILLIFKNDRKLRIEVGYGLEHKLTDALSSQIISGDIVPYFRKGQFEKGIVAGVRAIEQVVRGEYTAKAKKSKKKDLSLLQALFFLLIFFIIPWFFRGARYSKRGRSSGFLAGAILGSALGGRSGGSSGGFGGFSGGGGGFGGGGASGSW